MDEINALRQMLEELENGTELAEGKLTVAEYGLRVRSLIMSIKLMEKQMEVKTNMAIKLSDDELMAHFLNTAKEIQLRCDERNAIDCDSGNCPFSKDKHCIFGWHKDFNYPFDWKIGEEE